MSSIDEVRAVLGMTNERASGVAGALTQALMGAEEIRAQLQQVAASSSQATIQDAMGMYARLAEQIGEVRNTLLAAVTQVEAYAAHL